jgi:hypothetical protein
VTKISNGNVVIEVPDEKAFNYCVAMGYHIVKEESPVEPPEPVIPEPRKPRGRPRKVS